MSPLKDLQNDAARACGEAYSKGKEDGLSIGIDHLTTLELRARMKDIDVDQLIEYIQGKIVKLKNLRAETDLGRLGGNFDR